MSWLKIRQHNLSVANLKRADYTQRRICCGSFQSLLYNVLGVLTKLITEKEIRVFLFWKKLFNFFFAEKSILSRTLNSKYCWRY